jgi:TM2 domain-containing membrane protein YozV
MSGKTDFYSKYGKIAAKLSLAFPGLGQLHNKHYFKGMMVIMFFSLVSPSLFFFLTRPGHDINHPLIITLFCLLVIVWLVSIFDAYHTAIEDHRRSAKRYDVQTLINVRGLDAQKSDFEETAVTKNLSKSGACLIMSTQVDQGSRLLLEVKGKSRSYARVVWARETGNRNERLVGVKLQTPLRAL